MQLSKKSWHYRLVKYTLHNNQPYTLENISLCHYFWLISLSLYLVTFVWMWRSLGEGLRPLSIATAIGVTSSLCGLIWLHTIAILIYIPIAVGVGGLLSLVKAINERHTKIGDRYEKLNLFSQYVKSKKQRVCPIITWDDS